mmetsp:Transcript_29495/g.87379  ORF Transcript_29495/g.87379 Transcript_29495/m.87379 type:complete len:235 (+) Transcript_29495:922-1626(+)
MFGILAGIRIRDDSLALYVVLQVLRVRGLAEYAVVEGALPEHGLPALPVTRQAPRVAPGLEMIVLYHYLGVLRGREEHRVALHRRVEGDPLLPRKLPDFGLKVGDATLHQFDLRRGAAEDVGVRLDLLVRGNVERLAQHRTRTSNPLARRASRIVVVVFRDGSRLALLQHGVDRLLFICDACCDILRTDLRVNLQPLLSPTHTPISEACRSHCHFQLATFGALCFCTLIVKTVY